MGEITEYEITSSAAIGCGLVKINGDLAGNEYVNISVEPRVSLHDSKGKKNISGVTLFNPL